MSTNIQVHQVFQVRKVSLVSLVTPDCQDQTVAPESPDHKVQYGFTLKHTDTQTHIKTHVGK